MSLIGSLIAMIAAGAFILVATLVWWGLRRTLGREVLVGFRSRPPSTAAGLLTLLAIILPAAAASLLALLAAGRILLVALGAP